MKKTKLSNSILFLNIILGFIILSDHTYAQSTKKNEKRTQIVLNVTSDKSNISAIFEFVLIKNGKKGKAKNLKTPFKKAFELGNMTFLLKKISRNSNITFKVINIDKLNREIGNSSSTAQSVKFDIVGDNVSVSALK